MEFHFLSLLVRFAALSLCCLLVTVEDAESTFVPGRCNCPKTQMTVRRPMTHLAVTLSSPTCDNDEIIVVLRNKAQVCVNPTGRLGKRLIRCWKRVTKRGLDKTRCLKRKRIQGTGQKKKRGQARSLAAS
ncbi:interleukin-8-like [Osmerus mordax]|uniref:interleukin-8-like n=1 Tax=Osmerus mordax TaxID=8014 RepID=UPI0035100639